MPTKVIASLAGPLMEGWSNQTSLSGAAWSGLEKQEPRWRTSCSSALALREMLSGHAHHPLLSQLKWLLFSAGWGTSPQPCFAKERVYHLQDSQLQQFP